MSFNKKIFDKNTFEHKGIKIWHWKESSKNPANYENFQAYYLMKMYLISYEIDREIKIKFDNKYKIIKYLDTVANNTDFFVINGKFVGSEADLEVLGKEVEIIDPIIEQKKRDSWGGYLDEI